MSTSDADDRDANRKYVGTLFVRQDVLDAIYKKKHPSDADINDTLARILGIQSLPAGVVDGLPLSERARKFLIEKGCIDIRSIRNAARFSKREGLGRKTRLEILEALQSVYPDAIRDEEAAFMASLRSKL